MGKAQIKLRTPFKNRFVSVSRIRQYEKCPLAFAKSYIEKAPRKTSAAAEFGKLEHAALQRVYQLVCDEEFVGEVSDEMIITAYREAFEQSEVVGTEQYREGLKLLRQYFEGMSVDHSEVLAVERKFVVQLDGIEVLGYIDRVDRVDGQTILIDDYKTSRWLFSRDELDTDLQMGVYGLGARQQWPWAKHIRYQFDMLRHGFPQYTERTEDQLQETADYVVAITKRIESSLTFEAKLNPLCPYCDHRDGCAEYQDAVVAGETSLSYLVSATDMERVCAEWERAKALQTVARKRQDEMAEIIAQHLLSEQKRELQMGEMRFRLCQRSDTVYPHYSKVVEILSRSLGIPAEVVADKVLVAQKGAVDRLLKAAKLPPSKRQLVEAKLQSVSRKDPKKPYVDGREQHRRKA